MLLSCVLFFVYSKKYVGKNHWKRCVHFVCSVCYLLCVFRKVMAFNGSGLVGDGPQSKRLCTGKPGENNDSGNNNNNKVSHKCHSIKRQFHWKLTLPPFLCYKSIIIFVEQNFCRREKQLRRNEHYLAF